MVEKAGQERGSVLVKEAVIARIMAGLCTSRIMVQLMCSIQLLASGQKET